jgi:hypothetical protein
MTATPCVFATTATNGDTASVVCVNCGRPLTLPIANAARIIAVCRGESETRWRRDGSARACLVGTHLKALLAKVGIHATSDCPCALHASEMDIRGCAWCEENSETIVGWLREEATNRGLPFLDAAGRLLVRRAIRNARRAAAVN